MTDTTTPKRRPSPDLIANPFIKKRNLGWTLQSPTTASTATPDSQPDSASQGNTETGTTAAIESGKASTDDHLAFFTASLESHTRQLDTPIPLLPISSYEELYRSQAGSLEGSHFVIHQHDHPVAGTHYDLRLQINETSSVSWAVMYGLPGDPNSVRLNRNATETRIHCLWNHLIETASKETGSLLIWDTGTYSILPRRSKHAPSVDPSSPSSSSPDSPTGAPTQQDLLHAAFKNRKIRLRLHGTKLPDPYVLNLRLTKSEDASGRAKSARSMASTRRTRRKGRTPVVERASSTDRSADEESSDEGDAVVPQQEVDGDEKVSAMEKEIRELEDEQVRRTNAYPGASNTIGSVHQRRWYLSLERSACGFERVKNRWSLPSNGSKGVGNTQPETDQRLPWPFYVQGADHERSVVTGRRGKDVLEDEGVVGFVPRKGWNPILN